MRVLLIEDDNFFQNFYASKLKEAGFEVQTAVNGVEGLAKIHSFNPQIVLLDLIMPEKDGFAVLTEKSADPSIAQIPVMVFSTLGQDEDIKKALALGAHDYINKTFFDFDRVLGKIKALVPNNK